MFLSLLKPSRNKRRSQDVDRLCLLTHPIFRRYRKHRRQEIEEPGDVAGKGLLGADAHLPSVLTCTDQLCYSPL